MQRSHNHCPFLQAIGSRFMHDIQVDQYDELLAQKQQLIETQFKPFDMPKLAVYASEPLHFRQRAEFRIWHHEGRCFHAMFKPGTKSDPIEITDFPIASKVICDLIPKLNHALNSNPILKERLFTIEYLGALSGDMLVTLIYHRQLDDEWQLAAKALKAELGIHIIGRARKMRILLDQDHVIETLTVDGKELKYKQIEASFTQPNAHVNQHMLSWARACVKGSKGDLLELYCGNGNFSIALADLFNRVVATEISKTSVRAANDNKTMNGITNIDFAKVSAEEFTAHMNGSHLRRRLEDLALESADFQTVLVDPPRAGLDIESCRMIASYNNIVYISCNPNTLEDNLKELTKTHNIVRFAMFDQFPYTHHIESGVYLVKR